MVLGTDPKSWYWGAAFGVGACSGCWSCTGCGVLVLGVDSGTGFGLPGPYIQHRSGVFCLQKPQQCPAPPPARRVGAVRGAPSPCSSQGRCSSWAVGAVSQDITLHLNIVHCEFHQRTAKNWVYFPSLVHPWCPGVSCLSHPRWEGGSPHQGPGLVQVPPNEPAAIQQQMAWEGVRAMLSLPWGWDGTCGCCWGYWEAQGCSLSAACCCHPSCRQLRIFTASNDTESFSRQ